MALNHVSYRGDSWGQIVKHGDEQVFVQLEMNWMHSFDFEMMVVHVVIY